MSSSALLLRLFHSDFFNSWIAVSYLFKYKHSVGIQHYLCEELKKFPSDEIEFFLPQLVHLLVTHPSKFLVLEEFLLDRCEKSMHLAVLMLWYLQSYQSDYASTPHSQSAETCKRFLNQCEALVFQDIDSDIESDSEFDSNSFRRKSQPDNSKDQPLTTNPQRPQQRKLIRAQLRVQENAIPALVGMGCIMAGITTPLLTQGIAQLALTEGRRQRPVSSPELPPSPLHPTAPPPAVTQTKARRSSISLSPVPMRVDPDVQLPRSTSLISLPNSAALAQPSVSTTSLSGSTRGNKKQESKHPVCPASPSLEDLRRGKAFAEYGHRSSRKASGGVGGNVAGKSGTTRSSSALFSSVASVIASPPLKTLDVDVEFSTSPSEVQFVPEPHLPLTPPPASPSSTTITTTTIEDDKQALSPSALLSPNSISDAVHYVHSELTFIRSLIDISTRLFQVPKPARQSTLMAELELLNHNLPADVCLPLWCGSDNETIVSGSPRNENDHVTVEASASSIGHHRVLRIDTGDAVVLNSADRVPYLLLVEVLEKNSQNDDDDDDTESKLPPREPPLDTPRTRVVDLHIDTDDMQAKSPSIISPLPPIHSPTPMAASMLSVCHTSLDVMPSSDEGIDVPDFKIADKEALTDGISADSPKESTDGFSKASNAHPPPFPEILKPVPAALPAPELQSMLSNPLLAQNTTTSTPLVSPSAVATAAIMPESEYAERMRTAAVLLAQLASQTQLVSSPSNMNLAGAGSNHANSPHRVSSPKPTINATDEIRARIIREMMTLEEGRVSRLLKNGGRAITENDAGDVVSRSETDVSGDSGEGGASVMLIKNKDDPSAAVFREDWRTKKLRIKASSPYGHLPNWRLLSVIVKTGADLRQEQLACQLIREMQRVWAEGAIGVWVKYIRILVTSSDSGLIETIKNSISIHSLKKDAYARKLHMKQETENPYKIYSLLDHFRNEFGDPSTARFQKARDNFMRSLAGYSLICYILQVKDRHNGNILLDNEGHLIHIDFGYMLSNSPGSAAFERAPFKLVGEYVEVLGGFDGPMYLEFKKLFVKGFLALRKHADKILLLVEMMQKDSRLACFASNGEYAVQALRDRFQLSLTEPQVAEFAEKLILQSGYNTFTRLYDRFQYLSNGIL